MAKCQFSTMSSDFIIPFSTLWSLQKNIRTTVRWVGLLGEIMRSDRNNRAQLEKSRL